MLDSSLFSRSARRIEFVKDVNTNVVYAIIKKALFHTQYGVAAFMIDDIKGIIDKEVKDQKEDTDKETQ